MTFCPTVTFYPSLATDSTPIGSFTQERCDVSGMSCPRCSWWGLGSQGKVRSMYWWWFFILLHYTRITWTLGGMIKINEQDKITLQQIILNNHIFWVLFWHSSRWSRHTFCCTPFTTGGQRQTCPGWPSRRPHPKSSGSLPGSGRGLPAQTSPWEEEAVRWREVRRVGRVTNCLHPPSTPGTAVLRWRYGPAPFPSAGVRTGRTSRSSSF